MWQFGAQGFAPALLPESSRRRFLRLLIDVVNDAERRFVPHVIFAVNDAWDMSFGLLGAQNAEIGGRHP